MPATNAPAVERPGPAAIAAIAEADEDGAARSAPRITARRHGGREDRCPAVTPRGPATVG